MVVAPRAMAFQRRLRNNPGPVQGASEPTGLSHQVGGTGRYVVEVAFGADLTKGANSWNFFDITADVCIEDFRKIVIDPLGRLDESSQAEAANLTLCLDNTSGKYSPNNPNAFYWPNVKHNTPVRISLNTGTPGSRNVTRFFGYATGFTPSWNETGGIAVVQVSASGILRRLSQGSAPSKSLLKRAVLGTSPIVYWPLEDGTEATVASSAVTGGIPLNLYATGTVTASPQFGSLDGPLGSDKLPNFSNAASLAAFTPDASSATSWTVGFAVKFPTITGVNWSYAVNLFSTSGTVRYWNVMAFEQSVGGLSVDGLSDNGASSFGIGTNFNIADGEWHWVTVTATQVGADISVLIRADGNDGWLGYVFSNTLGPVASMQVNPAQPSLLYPSIGHVALWNGSTVPNLTNQMNGYTGETATDRILRLCGEEGVPVAITGTSSTTMGPQGSDTFLNLLRECETTDGGTLFDGLDSGLGYIARAAKYNQPASLTLDASNGDLTPPFMPIDDDQRLRNSVTVTRKNASSAMYEDVTGNLGTNNVGKYVSALTSNHDDDDDTANRAAWEVHKGTVEGLRYPVVNLDFTNIPSKIADWLNTAINERIDVTNLSNILIQHPPNDVQLLIEGYKETIGPFDWEVELNCSPFDPWRVVTIEGTGDTAFRLDSGSSSLLKAASTGATSLYVVSTNSAELWSTTTSDYPRDLNVAGVKVTATAVVSYLNANPYFESPLNASSWLGVNGATIAASSAQFHEGAQSLLITPDGVTAVTQAQSEAIPIVVGRSYSIHGWIRAAAGGDTLTLQINWHDGYDNYMSTSAISAAPSAGVWTEYGPTTFTAPANAAYARLVTNTPGTLLASHTWRLDEATISDTTMQVFTVNATTNAFPAGSTVHLWKAPTIAY